MTFISSHGSYTENRDWLEVKQAIEQQGAKREKLRSSFTVELVVATENTFKRTFQQVHPLFYEPQSWDAWKRDEEQNHNRRLSRFLQYCKVSGSVDDLSVNDYFDARFREHQNVIEDVFQRWNHTVYECEPSLPLYCWLIDGREAIFSLPTQDASGRYAGVAISTEDPNVVVALLRLFEHYKALSIIL